MSLFRCTSCGCVENTATSRFWMREPRDSPPLCSACDPEIGKWHDLFERTDADAAGYVSRPSGHFIELPASSTNHEPAGVGIEAGKPTQEASELHCSQPCQRTEPNNEEGA